MRYFTLSALFTGTQPVIPPKLYSVLLYVYEHNSLGSPGNALSAI